MILEPHSYFLMLAQLIHNFFDGTLSELQKTHILERIQKQPDAKEEFQHQQFVHAAVNADKATICGQSTSEEDLQAIFARVAPKKESSLPLPILPVADAQAPEFSLPNTGGEKIHQAGISRPFSVDKPSQHAPRRRFAPVLGKLALQALSFCVVGAVAATFGVMPLGKHSFKSNNIAKSTGESMIPKVMNLPIENDEAHNNSDDSGQIDIPEAIQNHPYFRHGGGEPINPATTNQLLQPLIVLKDSLDTYPIGVEKHFVAVRGAENDTEFLQDCPMKGAKPISWLLDEPTQTYATQLEITKLPRTKAVKSSKKPFEQSLALTARVSRNIFPNGFAGSIGAIFAISERDAIGLEFGGAFERPGFKNGRTEGVEILAPAGFVAGMYRFMMPVENTRFAGFSHIRLGVETTGAVFAGIGLGIQYGLTDKITVFASTEVSRALIPAASGDKPFNFAHDGVSLGVAVKL